MLATGLVLAPFCSSYLNSRLQLNDRDPTGGWLPYQRNSGIDQRLLTACMVVSVLSRKDRTTYLLKTTTTTKPRLYLANVRRGQLLKFWLLSSTPAPVLPKCTYISSQQHSAAKLTRIKQFAWNPDHHSCYLSSAGGQTRPLIIAPPLN